MVQLKIEKSKVLPKCNAAMLKLFSLEHDGVICQDLPFLFNMVLKELEEIIYFRLR
jgi:hypothetical protein